MALNLKTAMLYVAGAVACLVLVCLAAEASTAETNADESTNTSANVSVSANTATANTLSAPVQLNFDYRNGHIIAPACINSSKPLNFLVDTGASGVIIDQRTAYDIGLEMEQSVNVESAAGEVAVRSSHLARLSLSTLALTNIPVFIADLSAQSAQSGCTIAGVLGASLLDKFIVAIDYGAQTIELSDHLPYRLPAGTEAVPLFKDRPPLVQAVLNGQDHQLFVVDTGSSINNLPAEMATALRRKRATEVPQGEKPNSGESGMGLDGKELQLDTYVLNTVQLGNLVKKNVLCHFPLSASGQKFAKGFFLSSNIGVLGNPFWQEYKITLDYKEHMLFVQPGTTEKTRQEIIDAIAQGDASLNFHRQFEQAERSYNAALAKVNFAHDSKYQAIALERMANLKRIMAKELSRPEHAKVAYDYFVQALNAARVTGNRDVEARTLGDWSLLYSDNGQDPEAWQMIQTALQLAPDEAQVMLDKCVLLFRAMDYGDMQSLLKEVLARDPTNWQALWYQVKLAEISKNDSQLSYTLKQILQYYPWSKIAREKLSEAGKQSNKSDKEPKDKELKMDVQ